ALPRFAGLLQLAIGVAQSQRDHFQPGPAVVSGNETLRVLESRMRIAHDNIRFSEAGNDPALKHLAGRTGGTTTIFSSRPPHRPPIRTVHYNWHHTHPFPI